MISERASTSSKIRTRNQQCSDGVEILRVATTSTSHAPGIIPADPVATFLKTMMHPVELIGHPDGNIVYSRRLYNDITLRWNEGE